MIALGFIIYMIVDRTLSLHSHSHEDCKHEEHHHHERGMLGAASLALHSLLDGMAIGFAFQVSSGIGWVVTAAVLAHDFSDGINTVGLVLKNSASRQRAFRWLLVDALAPLAGILITNFIVVPEQILGMLLALFTGFFLYLGASDLLPESHHQHPAVWTTISTVLGVSLLFVVTRLAGL
jgi:ZIP family zinc transporter